MSNCVKYPALCAIVRCPNVARTRYGGMDLCLPHFGQALADNATSLGLLPADDPDAALDAAARIGGES